MKSEKYHVLPTNDIREKERRSMFLPNYTIGDKVGYSSLLVANYLRGNIRVDDGTQHYAIGNGEVLKNFNPYRDLQHGGTLLGFRGRNYWISDKCLLGKLLRRICGVGKT